MDRQTIFCGGQVEVSESSLRYNGQTLSLARIGSVFAAQKLRSPAGNAIGIILLVLATIQFISFTVSPQIGPVFLVALAAGSGLLWGSRKQ